MVPAIKAFTLGFLPTAGLVFGLNFAGIVEIPGFCGAECDRNAADDCDKPCHKGASEASLAATTHHAKAGLADAKGSDCAKPCAKSAGGVAAKAAPTDSVGSDCHKNKASQHLAKTNADSDAGSVPPCHRAKATIADSHGEDCDRKDCPKEDCMKRTAQRNHQATAL